MFMASSNKTPTLQQAAFARLIDVLREKNIEESDFYNGLGLEYPTQTWNNWKSRGLPHKEIPRLAEKAGLNHEWLAQGTGPKYKNIGRITGTLESVSGVMDTQFNNANFKIRHAPIVGKAQLGDNGYWCDMEYPNGYGDGYIKFPTDDEEVYALRCVGDSMRPRVKNGEFVIIEPNTPCQPGDEVLVKSKDGRVMVKIFLYEREGYFSFQSVNENHPSFSLPTEEIAAMHHVAAIVKSSRWIKY
jgi:phage repressor protein C with HTH and peptisase S24 domain